MIIKATPVDAFMSQQAKPSHRAPKLCVLRGLQSWQSEECNWMADSCIKALKGLVPGVSISDLDISQYNLVAGASNDPNDQRFEPGDQLPVFFDPVSQAHALLFVTQESVSLPDSSSVRLLERLSRFAKTEDGSRMFDKPKVAAVVVYGGQGVFAAGQALLSAANLLGCDTLPRSIVAFDRRLGELHNSQYVVPKLQVLARMYAKALKDV